MGAAALQNAVIYARYSSHGQTEQSIEGQLRDCYAFAEREGYVVVEEYIDRALTGRSDDRPDFQRMIADAPKKQFSYVIVWKLDRFARNRFDSANYKHQLKKHGVRVVSATERISDDPEGIMLEGMLESLAEYYSANLSQNVKRGQRESVIKGTYTGGIPPFGFKVVDKKLVADEATAPIIKWVFEQYASGVPKKLIMDTLNARGVKNYYGRPMSLSSLQHALRNRKYIGEYLYNGQEVTGGCEALIDVTTFNQVQERLDKLRHAPATKKARQDYLLQGKAFCGYCGTKLVGDGGTGKMGKVYHYYACGKKKKYRTCQKLNEKKDFLEWYVVEQTVEYVLTPPRMKYIASRLVERYEQDFGGAKVKEMERQLEKLERDISRAVDASIEAPSKKARERFYEKIETLEAKKEDLELDLARLRLVNGIQYTEEQIIAWMKTFCKGDPLDEVFRRRIIDVFINAVYVYDDKIVIYYNVKNGKQVSYMEMCEDLEGLEDLDGACYDMDKSSGVRISGNTLRHAAANSTEFAAAFCKRPFSFRRLTQIPDSRIASLRPRRSRLTTRSAHLRREFHCGRCLMSENEGKIGLIPRQKRGPNAARPG
ncbi:MAG: recombinase family protein [Christensenellaceae bacterium]|jgi:DNA invertase Pin-like site-specific DNA recombinase|nr:recombinase family protein [Christensenellaceae bacterium]